MHRLVLILILSASGITCASLTARLCIDPFITHAIVYAILTLYIMENWVLYHDLLRAQDTKQKDPAMKEAENKRVKFLLTTIKTLVHENQQMREIADFIARSVVNHSYSPSIRPSPGRKPTPLNALRPKRSCDSL